jgi:hypothetical protein
MSFSVPKKLFIAEPFTKGLREGTNERSACYTHPVWKKDTYSIKNHLQNVSNKEENYIFNDKIFETE